jgi:hypothetical protein
MYNNSAAQLGYLLRVKVRKYHFAIRTGSSNEAEKPLADLQQPKPTKCDHTKTLECLDTASEPITLSSVPPGKPEPVWCRSPRNVTLTEDKTILQSPHGWLHERIINVEQELLKNQLSNDKALQGFYPTYIEERLPK